MKIVKIIAVIALSLVGTAELGARAAPLGDGEVPIKLAINEWTGQHISTRIAGSILKKMGYSVEYITAGNYPQHTALADGTLHATLEVWSNNVGDIYPKMKQAGKIVDIGDLGLTTNEGWVYPRHMEELCPGLPDWKALIACKDLMATGDTFPDGRILSYPADWGTRSVDMIKGLALPYQAVPAGSEGALIAELKASILTKKPLVMMFWAPHWVFSDVDVGWVKLPKYDVACSEDPSWGPNPLEINDCGVDLPKTVKVAWAGFQNKWPAAWAFLQSYTMSTATQEKMMKAIDNDGQKIEVVVARWISDNEKIWKPWMEQALRD